MHMLCTGTKHAARSDGHVENPNEEEEEESSSSSNLCAADGGFFACERVRLWKIISYNSVQLLAHPV